VRLDGQVVHAVDGVAMVVWLVPLKGTFPATLTRRQANPAHAARISRGRAI
jgi:hypothetical protein